MVRQPPAEGVAQFFEVPISCIRLYSPGSDIYSVNAIDRSILQILRVIIVSISLVN